jgi:hypothetical protein
MKWERKCRHISRCQPTAKSYTRLKSSRGKVNIGRFNIISDLRNFFKNIGVCRYYRRQMSRKPCVEKNLGSCSWTLSSFSNWKANRIEHVTTLRPRTGIIHLTMILVVMYNEHPFHDIVWIAVFKNSRHIKRVTFKFSILHYQWQWQWQFPRKTNEMTN